MFERIEVDAIDMAGKVSFVVDAMFPETPLPESGFAMFGL